MAGQYGNPIYISAGLSWIEQVYGPPNQSLYGIAVAPYVSGTGSDLNSVFASLNSQLGSTQQTLQQSVSLADQYGLKMCCYESGISMFPNQTTYPIYQAAQQDPRMATFYQDYAGIMNAAGVDLCCFFDFIDDWVSTGFWGAAPDIRETITSPTTKYATEAAIANNGSQNIQTSSLTDSKPEQSKAAAAAAAKAAKAKDRAAAETAKIKAAEARAAAEAAKHKKHKSG